MKTITGNLVTLANEGRFSNIIHGCNCFNTMGAGVAKAIRWAFPQAYRVDQRSKKGDSRKLGTVSSALVEASEAGDDLRVINAYTQFRYGRGGQHVDYEAVRSCFSIIREQYAVPGSITAYPLIGCGLAGGDWNIISDIIDTELIDREHYLVKLG